MTKLLCRLLFRIARRNGWNYATIVFLETSSGDPYLSIRAKADGEGVVTDIYSFDGGKKWSKA